MLPPPVRLSEAEQDYPAWLIRFTHWMATVEVDQAVDRACCALIVMSAAWVAGNVIGALS